MLFGDDFRYMNAEQNYKSMDKMIEYMNQNYGDELYFVYSTPSIYIDALKKYEIKWPIKYDDGFPYSDEQHTFWAGYFTSRPNDKLYIRRASSYY